MSEHESLRQGEPCSMYGDVYKYFLDKPSQSTVSNPSTSTSSADKTPTLRSMLVTGFGMRNWDSLQRAILDDEQRRQMLLEQHDELEAFECASLASSETKKLFSLGSASKSTVVTDMSAMISPTYSLHYLMGLDEGPEGLEEAGSPGLEKPESIKSETEEEIDPRLTVAMRAARKYLNEHRIFDFYRFLIAHMLSELPDNPIEFLIGLLEKCLLYRSGFGNPPLLFEKPHLEQLFYLMDRMKTGFIEVEQYESGMKTLGICLFDKHPPLSTDGRVTKEFFIEEAYECLTDLFVDMVRRRGGRNTPPSLVTPPPTAILSSSASENGVA